MVDLGVAFIKAPASTLGGIWDGITGMSLEDAKNTLLGDWIQRKQNYEKGTPYDWYQGGRDGLSAVKYVMAGGFTAIRTGLEGAKDNLIPAFQKRLKEIDDYISSGEYLTKLNTAWGRYKARGGDIADFDIYKSRYETLTKNRMKGRIAEEVFQELDGGVVKRVNLPDGTTRIIDNFKDGVGREIKSGKLSRSDFIMEQIRKDVEILENGSFGVNKIEWHLMEGLDDDMRGVLEGLKRQYGANKFNYINYF